MVCNVFISTEFERIVLPRKMFNKKKQYNTLTKVGLHWKYHTSTGKNTTVNECSYNYFTWVFIKACLLYNLFKMIEIWFDLMVTNMVFDNQSDRGM